MRYIIGLFLGLLISISVPASGTDKNERDLLGHLSTVSSFQLVQYFQLVKLQLQTSYEPTSAGVAQHYENMTLLLLREYAEKYKSDRIWGKWFSEKTAFHQALYIELNKMLEDKKNKGAITDKQRVRLNELELEISNKLLK